VTHHSGFDTHRIVVRSVTLSDMRAARAASVLVGAVAIGVGASVALGGPVALTTAGLAAAALLLVWKRVPIVLSLGLLAAALILDYGLANVGIPLGALRIPVTDFILLPLLGWGLSGRLGSSVFRAGVLLACLVMVAVIRLAFDYPRFGMTAIRDSLIIWEALFLFVGYHVASVLGTARMARLLGWVFLFSLPYFALYPWRVEVAAAGPVVGIQQPVPLLGNYWAVGTASAAAIFLFGLVRPFGKLSFPVAGAFVPLLLMFQARSLYLAVPLAVLVVLVFAKPSRDRIRMALSGVLVVSSVVGALILPLNPEGRLGPVTPEFLVAHAQTLIGGEGPSAGTIRHRLNFYRETMAQVNRTPLGPIIGVGFGPDLIGGFTVEGGVLVRKPHNDYLEVFARTGLIGLVLFLGFLAACLVPVFHTARRLGTPFLWWVVAVATVFLLVAAAQPLLAYPFGTVPLFMILGAGLWEVDRAARSHGGISAPRP
jgi:O-antigen ligase